MDMHGRDSCFLEASYSCGPAGEYMDIEYNAVLYADGAAPAVGRAKRRVARA